MLCNKRSQIYKKREINRIIEVVMKKAALVLLVITIFLIWHVAQTGDETIIIYSPMEQYRNDELKPKLMWKAVIQMRILSLIWNAHIWKE